KIMGFRLPTRTGPAFECSTTGSSDAPQGLEAQTISCTGRSGVLLLLDLEVGHVSFQHRLLRASRMAPLQFAQRVNDTAASHRRRGSSQHVAAYACKDALVSLDGFEARITTCA